MFPAIFICLSFVLCEAGNRPPHIHSQPSNKDIFFKSGETIEILCVADGTPTPRYIWKRNGGVFNPSGQDDRVVQLPGQGTLVFNNPEAKDEGIYQCFADNGYGVSASVKVNLKEAVLKKFLYLPKTTHRVQAGNDLTLPCTPPQSNPPADVYWVLKSQNGRWEAVNLDKRVTMDFEGRLRFTNAKKIDAAGGRTYCCMVSNYLMRDNAIGPEHEVRVTGVTENKLPAHELWTSPSDQFFLRGQTLRLKCIFAGSPTPEVYWERIDAPLPDRAKIKSFGQELRINDLDYTDAGLYQCMGLNSQSTQRASKAFTVRIESSPYWKHKPVNEEAGVGDKATFICRADGTPKPDYTWFINGVPLEDSRTSIGVRDPRIYNNLRFFKPYTNNITLTNVTLDDHMNVQCNASNKHGYLFADVFLNVRAERPTIIKLPPALKKVTEGQSVVLDCLVTGKPDPIVSWYKDSSLITGGRFKIMADGNLLISKVVMADAGYYRCNASNIYGSTLSSICKTQIRSKTRITQFPLDLEVEAGYEAKFTCSGTTDFDEARNMRIYWEKDDKRLNVDHQRMSQNLNDNSLTISGTIIRDSGVYTCIITNGLDEDRAFAILTVKGRPDPPSSVEIERCRDDSATIKWIKGIENNAPVQYFIIQYNTSFYPDKWATVKSVDYTQSTATIDLKPWANYTFRVIATNKIGIGLPSQHTKIFCQTNPARPSGNPRNLRSIGDKRNTLVLQWTPMNEIEQNGPGFKYQLTIRKMGSTKYDTYSIRNWKKSTIAIPINATAYTPYHVRLYARNNLGDAKEDIVDTIMYSYEDIPTVRPFNVKIEQVGDTFASISWCWNTSWLKDDGKRIEIRGEMKGFKVQYWRTEAKMSSFYEQDVFIENVKQSNISHNNSTIVKQVVLDKLYPYSNITFQVRVINNYFAGPPSEKVYFQTLEGVPGPVQFLVAKVRNSNSITLSWKKPTKEDCNGILVGYECGYQTVDGLILGTFRDNVLSINDPDTDFAILGGLLPNQKYRVYVFARTSRGRGEAAFIEVSTTLKLLTTLSVFNVFDITKSSISISWGTEDASFQHTVHYIEYRKEGASDWYRTMDEVQRSFSVVTGLEAGTKYEIRIVIFNCQRYFSETKVIATASFAYPRSIATNYVWFILMITSGVVTIAVSVLIFLIYRQRKNAKNMPRYKRGIVIMDSIYKRRFVDKSDDNNKGNRPVAKNRSETRQNAIQEHFVQEIRFNPGGAYEKVRDDNKYVRCIDKGDVSDDENKSNSKRNSLYSSDEINSEIDSISDDYSEDSDKDYSDDDDEINVISNGDSDNHKDKYFERHNTKQPCANLESYSYTSSVNGRARKTEQCKLKSVKSDEDSNIEFADDDNDDVVVESTESHNLLTHDKRRGNNLFRENKKSSSSSRRKYLHELKNVSDGIHGQPRYIKKKYAYNSKPS